MGRRLGRTILIAAVPAAPVFITIPTLDAQPALPMPVTAPVNTSYDWTGWYVGGQVGYSQGRASGLAADPNPTRSSNAFGRSDGGLHLGYNDVVSSRLLVGAEADISFPYFFEDGVVSSPSTAARQQSHREDRLCLNPARPPRLRLGSLADLRNRRSRSVAARASLTVLPRPTIRTTSCACAWAGLWAQVPNSPLHAGWSARVEYLYTRLGHAGVGLPIRHRCSRRSRICIASGWDSVEGSAGRARTRPRAGPTVGGSRIRVGPALQRSPTSETSSPAAANTTGGISTGKTPSSNRAISTSDPPTKARIA